jgi:hypothetical protein
LVVCYAGNDTNYDLALYTWGLQTILAIGQEYNITDVNIPLWQDTLNR